MSRFTKVETVRRLAESKTDFLRVLEEDAFDVSLYKPDKTDPQTPHARDELYVIASGSGPVGDYMELEAFRGTRLRYRALFVLDRFNRYSIALPHVLGTRGLRVRVYQYWAGLGKAAHASI